MDDELAGKARRRRRVGEGGREIEEGDRWWTKGCVGRGKEGEKNRSVYHALSGEITGSREGGLSVRTICEQTREREIILQHLVGEGE